MAFKEGFTQVENYFFDHLMPRVSAAEWKVVCAVLRLTVGWEEQKGKRREEAEITVEHFQQLTGFASQALVLAIKNAVKRGAIQRRTRQVGRQRTFLFRAIPRANLKALTPEEARRHQDLLPFDGESQPWDGENQNPMSEFESVESPVENPANPNDGIVKTTMPNERWDFDNHNPNAPVLRSIKENRSLNTHTQATTDSENQNPSAASPRVCVSKFSKLQIREYAYASHNFTKRLRARGDKQAEGIRNPEGWATNAYRTGEHDDEIQEWIDDPEIFLLEQYG